MADDDRHEMRAGGLTAAVLAQGAELCSLQRQDGRELIWPAAERWPAHAPLLFPIVGELRDHQFRTGGRTYAMERHGFARRTRFAWLARATDRCTLAITDTPATREHYPFPFRLEVAYLLQPGGLRVEMTAINPGPGPLPCSMGFHPAFNWPLDGGRKEDHRIELDTPEDPTIGHLDTNGLVDRQLPTPFADGRVLHLTPAILSGDALILDPVHSRSARYLAPGGSGVEVRWEGATQLGIWSKPADFICIEPWMGVADSAGFTGDIEAKRGIVQVPPNGQATLAMEIRPIA